MRKGGRIISVMQRAHYNLRVYDLKLPQIDYYGGHELAKAAICTTLMSRCWSRLAADHPADLRCWCSGGHDKRLDPAARQLPKAKGVRICNVAKEVVSLQRWTVTYAQKLSIRHAWFLLLLPVATNRSQIPAVVRKLQRWPVTLRDLGGTSERSELAADPLSSVNIRQFRSPAPMVTGVTTRASRRRGRGHGADSDDE
jgi:hypothetical protein